MRVSGIQGGSVVRAAPVSTGGSRAEQAYRAAVKQLDDAQKRLNLDATHHADDKVIQLDTAAVTAAAAAVAAAAAELARQNMESAQGQSSSDPSASVQPSSDPSASVQPAAVTANGDPATRGAARTASSAWRVDIDA